MKKIKFNKIIIIFIAFLLFSFSFIVLNIQNQYIPYLDFYNKVNNNEVESVFYNDTDKIKFKTLESDEIFTTDNPRTENFKEELLLKNIKFDEVISVSNSISSLFGILFIGILIFFVYKNFKKSQKNVVANVAEFNHKAENNIFFKDIASNDEAKENSKDIIDFLKNPEKFERLNAKIPKGIIFYGKPGTGKTLMAKAIATEAGVSFYSANGSDFVEMYAGVGASRVRKLFEKARQSKKAVIFIDEIDAIGKKRSSSGENGNEEREQTLNALLTEMSGFSSDEQIIVIAATNRLDMLDEALLRAGRFDRHIEIALPDKTGRKKILSLLLKEKYVAENLDLNSIAEKTLYFSGAMLNTLVNEASIIAIKEGENFIEQNHIDKAFLKIIAGDEKKDRSSINIKDREITAFHEAGHALVTKLVDNKNTISKISIIPTTKGAGGFCLNIYEEKIFQTKKDLENQIMVAYAGRIAEEIIFGKDNITTGAFNDIEKATKIIIDYVSKYAMIDNLYLNYSVLKNENKLDELYREISSKLFNKCREIIVNNKETLAKIAKELIKKETLDTKDLNKIFNTVA